MPAKKFAAVIALLTVLIGCQDRYEPVADSNSLAESDVVIDNPGIIEGLDCDNAFVAFSGSSLWLAQVEDDGSSRIVFERSLGDDKIHDARLACEARVVAVRAARYSNVIHLVPVDDPASKSRIELDFLVNNIIVDKSSVWLLSGSKVYFAPPKPGLSDTLSAQLENFAKLLPPDQRTFENYPSGLNPESSNNVLGEILRLDLEDNSIVERRPFTSIGAVFPLDGHWIGIWRRKAFRYDKLSGSVEPLTNYDFGNVPFRNYFKTLWYSDNSYYFLSLAATRHADEPPAVDGIWKFEAANKKWELLDSIPFTPTAAILQLDKLVVVGQGHFGLYNYKSQRFEVLTRLPADRVPFGIVEVAKGSYAIIGMDLISKGKQLSNFKPKVFIDVVNNAGRVVSTAVVTDIANQAPDITSPFTSASGGNVRLF